ncbi:MAG: acyltransferase, partial [Clostridia bacterium]|nr:acyltransferase [Clostridia bacterium]
FKFFLFFRIKKYSRQETDSTYLSLANTYTLRGIMAILVVFCHIAREIDVGFFKSIRPAGYLMVSVFFFFSAYGLTVQYLKKGTAYLKSFFKRNILYLYIIFAITTAIYLAWYRICGQTYPIKRILFCIFGKTIASGSWYLCVCILFYIFFYIAFKLFGATHKAVIAVFIMQIVLALIYILAGYKSTWYRSNLSFTLGIFWALNFDKINAFLKKKYYLVLFCSLGVFLILTAIPYIFKNSGIDFKTLRIACRIFSTVAFSIFFVLIGKKIQFNKKIWGFVGSISLEIYLFHILIYKILRSEFIYIKNDLLWATLTILLTFLVAYVTHYGFVKIAKLLKN